MPTLIDLHPSVKFVLAHVGMNDVMTRNSTKLNADLKSLCYTFESLGRCCLMSGPIPTLSNSLDSSVYTSGWKASVLLQAMILSQILITFGPILVCTELHPNRKGTKQLTVNFIQFITFSSWYAPQHDPIQTPPSYPVLKVWVLPLWTLTLKRKLWKTPAILGLTLSQLTYVLIQETPWKWHSLMSDL